MTNRRELESLPLHGLPTDQGTPVAIVVDGDVQRALVLHAEDLAALPAAEVTADFECREGWCVPGLHWEGVALRTVLELAGASPEARFVQVSAHDFSTPISAEDASRALLATRLGDGPLPLEHGGPVRLIIPGADCYTSIKWVEHISVTDEPGDDTARDIALRRIGQA